ncbi:DUF3526 domain-containing protein [Chitinophaga sp. YIM B06452]|uniref:ABC transporter permease n=1 Tax=Chitinophaga sp. YIM B06452 TaxID=3082158 RepID=UPI0031FF224F
MKKQNMVLTIAVKEVVAAFRSRVATLLAFITWILLGVAVYTGMQQEREAAGKKSRAASLFRHEWEEQEANPHSAAHFGTYLFKPHTFLSIYDHGLNRFLGETYRVEAHVQHEVNHSEAETAGSQLRFGELSAAMVFQLLVPLLVLLLSFNAITRERESNTLRLLLIQGVKPAALIRGKIWGIYFIVLLVVLPAFLLMGIPVIVQDHGQDALLRYGLFTVAYLVYFFLFSGIGVLVSAWSRHSNAALIGSLGVWFLLAVLVPRAAVRMIDENNRLPSRFELNRRIAQGYSKGMGEDGTSIERNRKLLDSTLKRYKVDSVQQLPVNFDGLAMQNGEDYNTKVYEHYAGEVERTVRQQQESLGWVSFFDPFIAVQQVSMGVAGTDYHHHLSFHRQAKTYRDEFIRILNMDLANSGSAYLSYGYKAGPEFFKKMKDFRYNPQPAGLAVGQHRWSWLALAAWCLLVYILVNISAKRLTNIYP